MLQNQVRSSFCDFVTVVYIRRLHCGSPVLNCSLLLSSFFPERMFLIFAMSGLWHPPHVCMCLCRYPACVCAFLYTGTTCYSQGWSSLRPVSLCVYSSGGLLPPDYKKDWWINNILLSLALSLTLSEALKLVCACVCVFMSYCVCVYLYASSCIRKFVCVRAYVFVCIQAFLFVTTCVTSVCLCLQHLSVDQLLLHLTDSWPLLAWSCQRGIALRQS